MHVLESHHRMPVLEPLLALGSLGASVSAPAIAYGPVAADRTGVTRARDAVEALDLRTIQKPNLDRVHNESATGVIYSAWSSRGGCASPTRRRAASPVPPPDAVAPWLRGDGAHSSR